MPYSSFNTTVNNASSSSPYIYGLSPKEEDGYIAERRFPVPTPPPSSSSYVELAPIQFNVCDSADNRPPSPDSPKQKRLIIHHHHPQQQQQQQQQQHRLPAYLEPTPESKMNDTHFFTLDLFKVHKSKIPTMRRSSSLSRQVSSSRPVNTNIPSMSPILAAASISAASAADQQQPGSHVAKTLLGSVGHSKPIQYIPEDGDHTHHVASSKPLSRKHQDTNVDQSMFLTKNAHIKRPRNAWIHFRCHYGQALKTQDPTLRAEEISKRASRRWGKLSENEKKPWHGLAEQEKLAHREAFPEYRYCPRRANSSSSPSSSTPSSPPSCSNNRPSQLNTPLNMHDLFNSRGPKRMKRSSK